MTPGDEYDSVVSISDDCPLIQVFGPGRGGGISKALYETSKHSRPYFNTSAALIIQSMTLKVSAAGFTNVGLKLMFLAPG